MPNGNKPYKERDPSKAQPSSEISRDLVQLKSRIDQLEKDSAGEKNRWSSEVKGWIGKSINIAMTSGVTLLGELRWVDRYTLCLRGSVPDRDVRTIIVHKGAIAFMYQEDEAA